MGFLDRFRRRVSGPSGPQEVPVGGAGDAGGSAADDGSAPSIEVPAPPVAREPGPLPGPGTVTIGEVRLPTGRPVSADPSFFQQPEAPSGPVLWLTDEIVPDALGLWSALVDQFPESGLWPVLAGGLADDPTRPWETGELCPVPESALTGDALDVLTHGWRDGVISADDDVAPLRPFGFSFPGLSPATPDQPARVRVDDRRYADARIALVPCRRPADAVALVGWDGAANVMPAADISVVLRSWEDRFGAVLVRLDFDIVTLLIRRPPRTPAQAQAMAAELAALSSDELWQGPGTIEELAEELLDRPVLTIWWD